MYYPVLVIIMVWGTGDTVSKMYLPDERCEAAADDDEQQANPKASNCLRSSSDFTCDLLSSVRKESFYCRRRRRSRRRRRKCVGRIPHSLIRSSCERVADPQSQTHQNPIWSEWIEWCMDYFIYVAANKIIIQYLPIHNDKIPPYQHQVERSGVPHTQEPNNIFHRVSTVTVEKPTFQSES